MRSAFGKGYRHVLRCNEQNVWRCMLGMHAWHWMHARCMRGTALLHGMSPRARRAYQAKAVSTAHRRFGGGGAVPPSSAVALRDGDGV